MAKLLLVSEQDSEDTTAGLRLRAEGLRTAAEGMHELVAKAYLRRAAELELQVWLSDLRAGREVEPIAA
ncbi:MAG: hypothetical protein S0880_13460 [Actinomycetota bacterium]|nr:hypothetical protein [Actinomycetota bacterium]